MKKYNYIVFDWNGTLVNDLEINLYLCELLLKRRDLPMIPSKEFYLENFGFPIKPFYDLLGFDWNKETYEDVSIEYGVDYAREMKKAELFPDAIETLTLLKNQGKKLAIVSASMQQNLVEQSDRLGVGHFFDARLGANDNLGESKVGRLKKWFIQNNADAKEVLYVGDTTHDAETAVACGCDCILISRGHNSISRLKNTGFPVYDTLKEGLIR